ncbi:MAG: MFS transporter [Paludibacteraceae bacterium]
MDKTLKEDTKNKFSGYQIFVVIILTLLQFVVVIGFAIIAPIGDILMKSLNIDTSQYGVLVSSYAFGAGISGIVAAAVADKFDRKKFLLFFFAGFLVGILLCSLARNYSLLLIARIVSGVFGGVINAILLSIVADLFVINLRGRVMSYIQMAFSVSQILGIPLGLMLANKWGWNSVFVGIAGLGMIVGIVVALKMRPINEHLQLQTEKTNIFRNLKNVVADSRYLPGYLLLTLVTMGGAMLMPFGAPFLINNIRITTVELSIVYMFTGIAGVFLMIFIGKLSDTFPLKSVFFAGTLVTVIMTLIYTRLTPVPVWVIILINIFMFTGTNGRLIPTMTLNTVIPEPKDRGAYLSLCAAFQQIANGLGALLSGFIIVQTTKTGPLLNFDKAGYVVVIFSLICLFLFFRIAKTADLKTTKR